MTGYYNNLALHISEATLKAHRRLERETGPRWGYAVAAAVGAAALWAALLGLL